MGRRGWVRWLSGFLMVAALGAWPPQVLGVEVNQPAPRFSARDLDGNPVRLSDYLGKKHVYLWFWASW